MSLFFSHLFFSAAFIHSNICPHLNRHRNCRRTLCTSENLTQPKPTYFYIFKLETKCYWKIIFRKNNGKNATGNFDMLVKLFWGAGMVSRSKPNADIYFLISFPLDFLFTVLSIRLIYHLNINTYIHNILIHVQAGC